MAPAGSYECCREMCAKPNTGGNPYIPVCMAIRGWNPQRRGSWTTTMGIGILLQYPKWKNAYISRPGKRFCINPPKPYGRLAKHRQQHRIRKSRHHPRRRTRRPCIRQGRRSALEKYNVPAAIAPGLSRGASISGGYIPRAGCKNPES